jgi:uncharacterized protein YnzC (UPF0291/DUF896 family)
MAVQIIKRLLSDLSGAEAEETVKFTLDGKEYVVDLTGDENSEFREFMQRYVEAGRRNAREHGRASNVLPAAAQTQTQMDYLRSTAPAPLPAAAKKKAVRKRYLDEVRKWAATKGQEVSNYGRIPQSIIDMYENRHALEAAAIAEAAEKAKQLAQAKSDSLPVVDDKTPVKANGTAIRVPRGTSTNGAKPAVKQVPPATFSAGTKKTVAKKAPASKTTTARKVAASR